MKKRKFLSRSVSFLVVFSFLFVLFSVPSFAVSNSFSVDIGNKSYYGYYCTVSDVNTSPTLSVYDGVYVDDGSDAFQSWNYDFVFFSPASSYYVNTTSHSISARDCFDLISHFFNFNVFWNEYNAFDEILDFWYRGGYCFFESYQDWDGSPFSYNFSFINYVNSLYFFYQVTNTYAHRGGLGFLSDTDAYFLSLCSDDLNSVFLLSLYRVLGDLSRIFTSVNESDRLDLVYNSAFNSSGLISSFNSSTDFSRLYYLKIDYGSYKLTFPFANEYTFADAVLFATDSDNWSWLPSSFSAIILAFLASVITFGSAYGIAKLL